MSKMLVRVPARVSVGLGLRVRFADVSVHHIFLSNCALNSSPFLFPFLRNLKTIPTI